MMPEDSEEWATDCWGAWGHWCGGYNWRTGFFWGCRFGFETWRLGTKLPLQDAEDPSNMMVAGYSGMARVRTSCVFQTVQSALNASIPQNIVGSLLWFRVMAASFDQGHDGESTQRLELLVCRIWQFGSATCISVLWGDPTIYDWTACSWDTACFFGI